MLSSHASSLSQDVLNNKDILPHIFNCCIVLRIKVENDKADLERVKTKEIKKSAVDIINTMVNKVPGQLYACLPSTDYLGSGESINSKVKKQQRFRKILHTHYKI